METFYTQPELADVYFTFESEPQRLPAHKILLAAKSANFRMMFTDPLWSSNEIEIVDVSSAVFKEFLQFFYLDKIVLSQANLLDVLNLGKKYNVPECVEFVARALNQSLSQENICWTYQLAIGYDFPLLANKCEQFLRASISVESVLWVYKMVKFFNLKPLIRECERKIGFWAQELLKSINYTTCDQQTLKSILQINFLDCSEYELFNMTINWIKAAIATDTMTDELMKIEFGDLIQHIRFGAMSPENLKQLKRLYGNLIPTDVSHMMDCHTERYEAIPNDLQWNEEAAIKCYRQIDYSLSQQLVQSLETTIFWSKKSFLLGGFRFDYQLCHSKGVNLFSGSSIWDASYLKGIGYSDYSSIKRSSNNWDSWNRPTVVRQNRDEHNQTVKITIIRASKDLWSSKFNNEKILHTSSVVVAGERETIFTLVKPLLVQPKFIYIIKLEQSPNMFTSYKTKGETVVPVKPGFDIYFHSEQTEVINQLFMNTI